MLAYSETIAEKIRTASRAGLTAHKPLATPAVLKAGPLLSSEKLIAIGASTGDRGDPSCSATATALLPGGDYYSTYATGFTRSFAERLNKICQISVKEAEDGERVLPDTLISHRVIGIWSWHVVVPIIKSKFTLARR